MVLWSNREGPLLNQHLVERQQAKRVSMWTVFTIGDDCKQAPQETCGGIRAASHVHKRSWKGSKQGGDTFADDIDVNRTAGIKTNYKLLQKDLTVLKAGQEHSRWNAILIQPEVSESVYTHTLNLHESAHRLMSINQTLPLTIGILEFMWTVLWKYHPVLRRGHKRQVEDQELVEENKNQKAVLRYCAAHISWKVILVSFSKGQIRVWKHAVKTDKQDQKYRTASIWGEFKTSRLQREKETALGEGMGVKAWKAEDKWQSWW